MSYNFETSSVKQKLCSFMLRLPSDGRGSCKVSKLIRYTVPVSKLEKVKTFLDSHVNRKIHTFIRISGPASKI